MEQEEIDKMVELRKAANMIVNRLVDAGFNRKSLSMMGNFIQHHPLSNSFINLEINRIGKLIVDVRSKIILPSVYEELQKLAAEKGWFIKRS